MPSQRRWIVGRAPDCDLVVNEAAVSARHCTLTEAGIGFIIEDLGSANGVYVNGTLISSKTFVKRGDKVTLGQTVPLPWPMAAESALAATAAPARLPTPAPVPSPTIPQAIAASTGTSTVIRIGRAPDNDVVLDYPMVSARHAQIVIANGVACIEDLGSSNGIAIGRPENKVKRAPLSSTDTVNFGSLRMPASRLLGGNVALGEDPHMVVAFRGQPMIFGRDPQCAQPLNAPMISWHHACLSGSADNPLLEDLGSTNGTFINGQRIGGPTPVRSGDVIGLGTYTFKLTAGGNLEKRDYRGNVTIEVRNLSVDVPGKRLLDNVSLTIYPSEFVGLMGPSGAGKTTLMNALNGYTRPSAGEVLLNGQNLYASYAQFATYLGYVPQDDIIHRDLTVGQALYYTARLRLPSDFKKVEVDERITQVLKQLGLEAVRNVLIGSPEKKGISGGQRKRVNLAMELLTDPLVLFLDEPTSGLSSEDALMVMKVLRSLADAGKTILLTIHQPSLEAFRLMDNLVLVSKDQGSADPGVLAYYGPAYPDAVHFFNPDGVANARPGVDPSPDEVLRGLAQRKTAEWSGRYQQSRFHKEYIQERAGKQPANVSQLPFLKNSHAFGLWQWWTLVNRCLAIKLRDTWFTTILMVQAPIIAFLVVLVFGGQLREVITDQSPYKDWAESARAVGIAVFVMTLSAFWFGSSNAIREIVGEWAIYHRERMINLKISSYVGSKLTVLGGQCLIQCALLLGIIYWGGGLKGPWFEMYLFLVLVSFVGIAIGLTLSAVAKTSEVAIALLPILLLPMIVLGGMVQPVHKMAWPVRVLCALMPERWAFEGMLLMESKSHPEGTAPPVLPAPPPASQDMAESYFPKEDKRSGEVVATLALSLLFLGTVGLIQLILRWRDVH